MSKRKPKPPKIDVERDRAAKKERFLRCLETGKYNYTQATKEAGISMATVYCWRRDDALFNYEVIAVGHATAERLINHAYVLAFEGQRKYKFEKGRPQMWLNPATGEVEHYFEVQYDTTLLMELLRAFVPYMFCAATRADNIRRTVAKLDGESGSGPTAEDYAGVRDFLNKLAVAKRDGNSSND